MAAGGGFLGFPVGVMFEPTDEELIEHYLLPKVKGSYNDYGVVTDADVFDLGLVPKFLPELARYNPGAVDGSLHFFSPRTRSTPNGTRAKRTKDNRGWVSTDRPRGIQNKYGQDIGQRRLFVYKIRGKNTEWRLHEFTLHGIYVESSSSSSSGKGKGKEKATGSSSYQDLVLCRVWYKPADEKNKPPAVLYNQVQASEPEPHQQQFAEQQQPSCSYNQEEEKVATNSIPITLTALLEQSSDGAFLHNDNELLKSFMSYC